MTSMDHTLFLHTIQDNQAQLNQQYCTITYDQSLGSVLKTATKDTQSNLIHKRKPTTFGA